MDAVPLGSVPAAWSDADRALLGHLLPRFIAGRRWYRAKAQQLRAVHVLDTVPLTERAVLAIAAVETDQETYRYALPLALLGSPQPPGMAGEPIAVTREGRTLCEGLEDPELLRSWVDLVLHGREPRGRSSRLRREIIAGGPPPDSAALPARRLSGEQSNSTVVYGERLVMKLFRQLDTGESCELEIGRFLTGVGFPHIAPLSGALSWVPDVRPAPPVGEPDGDATIAVLQEFVPNAATAWDRALERLTHLATPAETPLSVERCWASGLGRRLGELHVALSSKAADPAFAPEPLTTAEQERLAERASASFEQGLTTLHGGPVPDAELSWLWDREAEVHARIDEFRNVPVGGQVARVHGDLHLGQLLEQNDGVKFIDFEGEPSRSLAERRTKRSLLVDVASMLRSFQYAAFAVQRSHPELKDALRQWTRVVSEEFTQSHLTALRGSPLLPPNAAARSFALRFFVLEKCLYELRYELDNRPDWVEVPLDGLRELLSD